MLSKLESSIGTAVDFVRAIRKTHGSYGGIIACESSLGNAGTAESLYRLINDLECHSRRGDLDHSDLELVGFVADPIHHVGGLETEQTVQLSVESSFCNRCSQTKCSMIVLP